MFGVPFCAAMMPTVAVVLTIADTTPKILVRLDIDTDTFIEYATRFLKEFGHAVGRPEALVAHAAKRQAKYLRGIKTARKMYGERKAA